MDRIASILKVLILCLITLFLSNCLELLTGVQLHFQGIAVVNTFSIVHNNELIFEYAFPSEVPPYVGQDWTIDEGNGVAGFPFVLKSTEKILRFQNWGYVYLSYDDPYAAGNSIVYELPPSNFEIDLRDNLDQLLLAVENQTTFDMPNSSFSNSITIDDLIVTDLSASLSFSSKEVYPHDFGNCGDSHSEEDGTKYRGTFIIQGTSDQGFPLSISMDIYWVEFDYTTTALCD